MPSVTLDPLRWRDPPARAAVTVDAGAPRVRLQMTAPREVSAMCVGRPVEELPRILSILSPAHHLCAALVLDRLFGVDPPAVARHTREALRLALVFRHHLRKLHFLVSSVESPFAEFWPGGARRGPQGLRPLLDELMRHVSAAQEAAAILGGRADHPVTAVAGGVTRALKQEHLVRLAELALACRGCAERVAGFLRERVLSAGEILGDVRTLDPGPLATLALAEADALVLRDARGGEVERFASAALFEKVGLHQESWSREPFAVLAAAGWQGLDAARPDGLFLVGPLARLGGGGPLATPLAEAERLRLVEALGPFPRFEVVAAYWALLVELLSAAEGLVALCDAEKLTGPALRTAPKAPGREGHAALESAQGLICHHVRVDGRGVVEEVRVLDAATANNGLLGIVAQRAVESSLAQGQPWDETKKRMELALLAY
jgi:F420-non-reducing hydrogenase large subunit